MSPYEGAAVVGVGVGSGVGVGVGVGVDVGVGVADVGDLVLLSLVKGVEDVLAMVLAMMSV